MLGEASHLHMLGETGHPHMLSEAGHPHMLGEAGHPHMLGILPGFKHLCLSIHYSFSIHCHKTSNILFSNKQDDPKNTINIDSINIKRVFSNKFLGVTIDHKF